MTSLVARQPIFDRHQRIVAYELLYRGPTSDLDGVDPGSAATARVLVDLLAGDGFDRLASGETLFVNATRAVLDLPLEQLLPTDRIVVEVLEDIVPDAAATAAVRRLKAAGVRIALDDFVWSAAHEPLLALADYVKLDVQATPAAELANAVALARRHGAQVVGEKVETHAEFARARELGCSAFQGYYFCRPESQIATPLAGGELVALELVARLQDPDASIAQLAALLSRDVGLTYQLLRMANNPLRRARKPIERLEDALVRLGLDTLRSWASVLMLARLRSTKPAELLRVALLRAETCARLADSFSNVSAQQLHTAGLLSVLDALLDRPMQEIVAALPLPQPVVRGLLGDQSSPVGAALATVVDYERGRWDSIGDRARSDSVTAVQCAYWAALAAVRDFERQSPVDE